MEKEKRGQGRKCFIITPIGDANSDIFRKAKGVIESVIKPVLEEYSYEDIKPAYEINISGMINTQIINRIINDDLVIANLTGNNSNVMYELCLRHVVAKPIIHICESGTSLPFDIKDSRTIFYENDMLGVDELKEKMKLFMDEIDYGRECIENPIYTAYKYGKLLKETQKTSENEMLNLLLDISNDVSEIKNDRNRSNAFIPYISAQSKDDSKKTIRDYVNEIDMDKVYDISKHLPTYRIRVHELADQLNTTSRFILMVAHKASVNVNTASSSLDTHSLEKILEYIVVASKSIDA